MKSVRESSERSGPQFLVNKPTGRKFSNLRVTDEKFESLISFW